jgi:hypothetical protein
MQGRRGLQMSRKNNAQHSREQAGGDGGCRMGIIWPLAVGGFYCGLLAPQVRPPTQPDNVTLAQAGHGLDHH